MAIILMVMSSDRFYIHVSAIAVICEENHIYHNHMYFKMNPETLLKILKKLCNIKMIYKVFLIQFKT